MSSEVPQNLFADITDPESLADIAEAEKALLGTVIPRPSGVLRVRIQGGNLRFRVDQLTGTASTNDQEHGYAIFKGNTIGSSVSGRPFKLISRGDVAEIFVDEKLVYTGTGYKRINWRGHTV